MSNVFTVKDPAGYAAINRSVRIGGHSTSIQLERAFWDLLDEIAASRGLTTSKFISLLYDDAVTLRGKVHNFASILRTSCVLYLNRMRTQASETAAWHTEAV